MRKFIVLLFCVLIYSFTLCGCMDKIEAEDRGYVITMGVDKGVENKYEFSFVTASLSDKGAGTSGGDIIKVSGDSILEAINKGDSYTNKLLYLGQLKNVVFSKSIVEDYQLFFNVLSQLESNRDVSVKTVILGTESKSQDLISIISENELSSGVYIYDFYKNSAEKTSFTEKTELESLMIDLRQNKSVVLPLISFDDNDLKIGGGLLTGEKGFKGVISEDYIMSGIWLKNKAEGAVIVNSNGDTLSVIDNYCKYDFNEKNGYITCNIDIEARGSIDGLYSSEEIESMEKDFENMIEDNILKYIDFLKYECMEDPLGFSNRLKKHNKDLYYKYGEEQSFYSMNFNIDCDLKIKSTGMGG